jgi:hypothetical protein
MLRHAVAALLSTSSASGMWHALHVWPVTIPAGISRDSKLVVFGE